MAGPPRWLPIRELLEGQPSLTFPLDLMSSRFTWKSRMGIMSVLLTLTAAAALIVTPKLKPMTAPRVAIFDPRLSVLWAQMRKGSNTYYLPAGGNVLGSEGRFGSTLEGKVRGEIRKLGMNIDTLPAFRPGTGTGGRAFLVGYAFPVPPTSSVHLVAELVAEDGALYPLRSAAGGGGGPPERSWNLWTLDSLPSVVTNYALRLKAETNGTPIAEIKFAEP
jgi:hypothetical protein